MKKKWLCLFLVVAFAITLMPASLASNDAGTITGTFTYCPGLGMMGASNQTQTFTYSDDNFTLTGYDYHKGTAVQSMEFSLASFGSSGAGAEGSNENQIDYLTKCGFTDYMANEDYTSQTYADSIGVGIAQKQIKDNGGTYTLLAVGIRGHNYFSEWGGNFRVGETGDHTGFAICRDKTLDFIRTYISEKNVTGRIKLWVTGYSRAAATANMVGGALDDGASLGDNVSLSRHDMYIYCFECPQGTDNENAHDPVYGNIHNIINPNDLVPTVGPSQWGFTRYGVDHVLPASEKDSDYEVLRAKMLVEFAKFNVTGPYMVDLFQMYTLGDGNSLLPVKKVHQSEYYQMLTDAMTTDMVPSRAEYVATMEDDMIELTATLFGLDTSGMGTVAKGFLKRVSENAGDIVGSVLGGDTDSAKTVLLQALMDSFKDAGVSSYDADQVSAMLDNLMGPLTDFIKADPDLVLTLLGNVLFILDAHWPEICTSWVRTLDEEYMTSQQPYVYSGAFNDVSASDWYAPYVDYAYYGKLMVGDSGSFEPNSAVTRGMFVQTLYALEGKPAVSGGNPFSDSTGWYGDAITWAYQNGVTGGVSATSFAPNQEITREEMAVMLRAYQAKSGEPASASGAADGFADASSVSSWATEGVAWAVANGVMAGSDDNMLHPQDTCTRAETATMIRGFCEQ